jgi:hypothetical protein
VVVSSPELGLTDRREDSLNILTVNLLFSTLIFWIAARIYVVPKLPQLSPRTVLVPILLLHSFRHLGLMFLAPGATYAGIPPEFARPAAFGDLIAAILALLALAAVVTGSGAARPLLWIFNVEGTLDFLQAIFLSNRYGADPYMGPAYWIPAFWVPMLLVGHYLVFVILVRPWKGDTRRSAPGET